MKTVYVSLLAAVLFVLAFSANAQLEDSDCPKFCTYEYRPVCGYDGNCYHKYGNGCTLKLDRCTNQNKKDVKSVDMERCEEAMAKSNPDVVECSYEE